MTEDQLMPIVRATWAKRVNDLGLKGKARQRESEAYLQGVLTVAVASGIMTSDRAAMIAMLVMIGRGQEYLKMAKE